MRYALAFLLISCVRLVSADDIDMTYSDCVASWGEPAYVAMDMVRDPAETSVNFNWFSEKAHRPGRLVQYEFRKAADPEWKSLKPKSVNYYLTEGDQYKDHQIILDNNKGNSEWEKPERFGDVDPITGISNGKAGERKWKRRDGKVLATLIDVSGSEFVEEEWELSIWYVNGDGINATDEQQASMPADGKEKGVDKGPTFSPFDQDDMVAEQSESVESKIDSSIAKKLIDKLKNSSNQEFCLSELTELNLISKDGAQELAKFRGDQLDLWSLREIDEEVAQELANFGGHDLTIPFLPSINRNVAKQLAQFKGSCLTFFASDHNLTINREVAQELAMFQGALYLLNIKSIDRNAAQQLAKLQGPSLFLDVKSIDKDAAQELAKFRGQVLSLKVKSIDRDIAQQLASFGEHNINTVLEIKGLTEIDKGVAQELAKFQGASLQFFYLPKIDKEVAQELAKFDGEHLYFYRLPSIDNEVAHELAKKKWGSLTITGPRSIDRETAQELAQFRGDMLSLDDLASIDEEVAQELEKFKGYLSLDRKNLIQNTTTQQSSDNKNKPIEMVNDPQQMQVQSLKNSGGDTVRKGVSTIEPNLRTIIGEVDGWITHWDQRVNMFETKGTDRWMEASNNLIQAQLERGELRQIERAPSRYTAKLLKAHLEKWSKKRYYDTLEYGQ